MRFGLKGNAKAKASAIGCNYWIGPWFGGDLIVWHNCMGSINTRSSDFGSYYTNYTRFDGKTFLTGGQYFDVKEIEIFQVVD
jgi:hypothetical protein